MLLRSVAVLIARVGFQVLGCDENIGFLIHHSSFPRLFELELTFGTLSILLLNLTSIQIAHGKVRLVSSSSYLVRESDIHVTSASCIQVSQLDGPKCMPTAIIP